MAIWTRCFEFLSAGAVPLTVSAPSVKSELLGLTRFMADSPTPPALIDFEFLTSVGHVAIKHDKAVRRRRDFQDFECAWKRSTKRWSMLFSTGTARVGSPPSWRVTCRSLAASEVDRS
jgi:hypothetical protein